MKKPVKILAPIFLLGFLYGTRVLYSQELANYSAAFADVGFGARPLALGGAFTALANDANAVVWNPAGIVELNGFEATFSYAKQFGLIPYTYAAAVYPFGGEVSLGGGVIVSGDDLLREVSILTVMAFHFRLDRYPVNLGFNLSLHNATFGNNHSRYRSVQGEAMGYSAGIGMQLYLTDHVILASYFQNLLNTMSWNSSTSGHYSEGLPRRWSIAIGLKNLNHFNFDLDLQKSLYREIDDKFFLGAERELFQLVFLRIGAASSINAADRLFYSFGGGVRQKIQETWEFQMDLAYVVHPLENMFRISISISLE